MFNVVRHKTADPLKPITELSKEDFTSFQEFIEYYSGSLTTVERKAADKRVNSWFEKLYGESICASCNIKYKFSQLLSYVESKPQFIAPKPVVSNVTKSVSKPSENV